MKNENESFDKDSELSDLSGKLGSRISSLSRHTPPENLAAKTVAYVQANCPPKKRRVWLLQPITHPAARVAAAAVIVLILSPLTDLETAASLGSRIEQRVIGPKMMDKLEVFMDPVLPTTENYSEPYFDSFLNLERRPTPRKTTPKPAPQQHRRV